MMSSQQIGDEALRIFQSTKSENRKIAEALLDEFFCYARRDEYEDLINRMEKALNDERS